VSSSTRLQISFSVAGAGAEAAVACAVAVAATRNSTLNKIAPSDVGKPSVFTFLNSINQLPGATFFDQRPKYSAHGLDLAG
jgi:hypothetical protein